MKNKINFIDLKSVFKVRRLHMYKEAWWYWFWLFFFENPENPEKPKQLMILWSSKNEDNVKCNGLNFKLKDPLNKNILKGAVASWYFDGKKMHKNFILERCNIKFSNSSLSTDSCIQTLFKVNGKNCTIKMGNDVELFAEEKLKPTVDALALKKSSKITAIDARRFSVKGKAFGKRVKGTAFFECVFCSLPIPSWYWGIFHFKNGATLNYFYPYFFNERLGVGTMLFNDKGKTYVFRGLKIKETISRGLPSFKVSGKNKNQTINFNVKTYSHAQWLIEKRHLKIIPFALFYNEFPSIITNFTLEEKVSKKKTDLKSLGDAVGNTDHTKGMLL